LWAIIKKDTDECIGDCGLTFQDFNGKEVLEIGYHLQKKFWHQGFATECAIACKEYAFNKLNANEVFSIIRDNNIPSQRVALRNGMSICGSFVKHYYNIDMPHIVFSVKKT
jgi:RimJ/RimL family protein N-acetyltransferase